MLHCCCWVIKSSPTLCDPMNCSMRGFLILYYLPEFAQPMSIESVMASNHLILCHPFLLLPQSLIASGSLPMSWFFASRDQSISTSASASVLPMNIQDWFPSGWTGWISLQSKGLSRVFSNTTVQKHQPSVLSFLYSPTLTSIHDYWKNHSFD